MGKFFNRMWSGSSMIEPEDMELPDKPMGFKVIVNEVRHDKVAWWHSSCWYSWLWAFLLPQP